MGVTGSVCKQTKRKPPSTSLTPKKGKTGEELEGEGPNHDEYSTVWKVRLINESSRSVMTKGVTQRGQRH